MRDSPVGCFDLRMALWNRATPAEEAQIAAEQFQDGGASGRNRFLDSLESTSVAANRTKSHWLVSELTCLVTAGPAELAKEQSFRRMNIGHAVPVVKKSDATCLPANP